MWEFLAILVQEVRLTKMSHGSKKLSAADFPLDTGGARLGELKEKRSLGCDTCYYDGNVKVMKELFAVAGRQRILIQVSSLAVAIALAL